jgi:hypothetical protein
MLVGAGVVGDITNREERASFYALYLLGPLVSWNWLLVPDAVDEF